MKHFQQVLIQEKVYINDYLILIHQFKALSEKKVRLPKGKIY